MEAIHVGKPRLSKEYLQTLKLDVEGPIQPILSWGVTGSQIFFLWGTEIWRELVIGQGGSLAVWKVCEREMAVDLGGKLVVH